ncbi:hypothetical protein MKJ04_00900 [Pontibacter sp. E15-1]|uniref:hypothetical protein n=1 Tax=Pontibacter sp. E15-1 TaxID=2919918 RepID=UPI001F4F9B75|nr:hypothetical protein [Pontibacter sp. E15-1]MCJ8163380.1 hypothetical protein [Pontibacter sp. E15-1]
MKKHLLWMIIGCTLPLLLIFLAPALWLSGNVSLFIFIIVMFACHLLMPMHHGGPKHGQHNQGEQSQEIKTSKDGGPEHGQHKPYLNHDS